MTQPQLESQLTANNQPERFGLYLVLTNPLTGYEHCAEAAVKALLCGAAAVEVCTAIHREGFDVIARMNEWIDAWAARHGITALDEFKGRLGFGKSDSEFFQRVQYMKYFPGKD